MSGLLAVRIFVFAMYIMVAILDGTLFWSISKPFATGLEGYIGFLVFVCFAIWVTMRNGATLLQKLAHEVLLDIALVSLAFRSISGLVLVATEGAGAHGTCEISRFVLFLRVGTIEMWIQFLIVFGIARMLIWASSTMVHDATHPKKLRRGR
jgi:hypothetical protein